MRRRPGLGESNVDVVSMSPGEGTPLPFLRAVLHMWLVAQRFAADGSTIGTPVNVTAPFLGFGYLALHPTLPKMLFATQDPRCVPDVEHVRRATTVSRALRVCTLRTYCALRTHPEAEWTARHPPPNPPTGRSAATKT